MEQAAKVAVIEREVLGEQRLLQVPHELTGIAARRLDESLDPGVGFRGEHGVEVEGGNAVRDHLVGGVEPGLVAHARGVPQLDHRHEVDLPNELARYQRRRDRVQDVDRQAQVGCAVAEEPLGALEHLVPGRAGAAQLFERIDDDDQAVALERDGASLHLPQLVAHLGEEVVEMRAERGSHTRAEVWPGLQLGGELDDFVDPELDLRQGHVDALQPLPQAVEVALLHGHVRVLALSLDELALGGREDRKEHVGDIDRRGDVDRVFGIDEHDEEVLLGEALRQPQQLSRLPGSQEPGEGPTSRLLGPFDRRSEPRYPVNPAHASFVEGDVAVIIRRESVVRVAPPEEKTETWEIKRHGGRDLYHRRVGTPQTPTPAGRERRPRERLCSRSRPGLEAHGVRDGAAAAARVYDRSGGVASATVRARLERAPSRRSLGSSSGRVRPTPSSPSLRRARPPLGGQPCACHLHVGPLVAVDPALVAQEAGEPGAHRVQAPADEHLRVADRGADALQGVALHDTGGDLVCAGEIPWSAHGRSVTRAPRVPQTEREVIR